MVSAILGLLVLLIICGFLIYIVGLAPIDATVKQIAKALVLLLLVLGVIYFVASLFGYSFPVAVRR